MILDNEASIKAVMENFKEENAELSEVIWQLGNRVTEILQGMSSARTRALIGSHSTKKTKKKQHNKI